MKIFATIATLFVLGSTMGWVIELFFRRFVSQKKWMNPGFLVGPYLPIYGFGTIGLYGLSNISMESFSMSAPVEIIVRILLIAVIMILVEFIAGLIFIKGMNIRLWDYSNRKGNIMGIICPAFSVIWLAVGALYYFFLNPILVQGINWLASEDHNIYYFFVGLVVGMMIVDFAYSIHLATKITKFAKENKVIVSIEKLRLLAKEKAEEIKDKAKAKRSSFFLPINNADSLKKTLEEFIKARKEEKELAKEEKQKEIKEEK